MDDPIGKPSAKNLREGLQVDRVVFQDNSARFSMESEVKNAVAVPSRHYLNVMDEFLGSVAGEMDESDVISSGDEFKDGQDAKPVFYIVIPKGFKANDVLLVPLG